jgi:hypothetical protein
MSKPEHNWRGFQQVHPAADDYELLGDDELKALAESIKDGGLRVPIQTRRVAGEERFYVIDGRNRLDAMEKVLGWQIVDEKGNWCGALAIVPGAKPNVQHKDNYTHEQIIAEIDDLNLHRRHLTESQRAMIAAKRRERAAEKKSFSEISDKLSKRGRPEGRPSKGILEARRQEAKKMKVSESSVERAERVRKQAPEKVPEIMAGKKTIGKAVGELRKERKGKLLNGDDAEKAFDLKAFEERIRQYLEGKKGLLNHFDNKRQQDVRRVIADWLFGEYSSKLNKDVVPEHVLYPGEIKLGFYDALTSDARREAKVAPALKVKAVKSHNITAAVIGAPSPKKANPKADVSEAIIQEAKDKITSGKAKVDAKGNLIDKATGKIICQVVREGGLITEAKTGRLLYGAIRFS